MSASDHLLCGMGRKHECREHEKKARKLSFPNVSDLWDGTDTDAVDEGTLENLAFLAGATQKDKDMRQKKKNVTAGQDNEKICAIISNTQ